jgi:hypothetical protein
MQGDDYVIELTLEPGKSYGIRLGLDPVKNRFLKYQEIAGNRFASLSERIFRFDAGNDYIARPEGDGFGTNFIDTTSNGNDSLPGVYGDTGEDWQLRFENILHVSEPDSVIIYFNYSDIACQTYPGFVEATFYGEEEPDTLENVRFNAEKDVGWVTLPMADLQQEVLFHRRGRGQCYLPFTGATSDDPYVAIIIQSSLSKMAAGSNNGPRVIILN